MAQAIQPVSQPTITDRNRALAADSARISRLGTPPTIRKGGGGVSLAESFTSSLHNLSANVTRTILTMLGIIIGVASVIALLAYGNGVVAKALTALERNGTNLITIQGASQSAGGVATGNQSQTLTLADATALADPSNCPDCGAVSPEVQRGGQITANGKNTFGAALGVWPSYADVHAYNVTSGSFIADSDVTGTRRSSPSARTIATTLFSGVDPTGQTIRLSGNSFKVIGVMEAKGGNGFGSLDNQVYVPITTAMAKLTGGRGGAPTGAGKVVSTIYVKATSANAVSKAISEVNTTLGGAAQYQVRRAGLAGDEPGGSAAGGEGHPEDLPDLPLRHRLHLAPGRRHRHHEHHAGQRHRADAGDRHPQGDRGEEARHPHPVRHRGGA